MKLNLKLILKKQDFPSFEWIIVVTGKKEKYVVGFSYPPEPYRALDVNEVRVAVGCYACIGDKLPYVWTGKGDDAQRVCDLLTAKGVKCKVIEKSKSFSHP